MTNIVILIWSLLLGKTMMAMYRVQGHARWQTDRQTRQRQRDKHADRQTDILFWLTDTQMDIKHKKLGEIKIYHA